MTSLGERGSGDISCGRVRLRGWWGKVGSEVLGERPMHHGQFGTGSDLGDLLVNLSIFGDCMSYG